MLEHHADAAAKRNQPGLIERGDVLSVDENSSGAWRFEAIDRPQKARLAGAASADDPEYRPARYGKINAMQGVNRSGGRSVDFPDMVENNRREASAGIADGASGNGRRDPRTGLEGASSGGLTQRH